MEFKRCTRCGGFYISEGDVCSNCITKDNLELGTFRNYVQENGLSNSLEHLSNQTGISVKNLSRFISYGGFDND